MTLSCSFNPVTHKPITEPMTNKTKKSATALADEIFFYIFDQLFNKKSVKFEELEKSYPAIDKSELKTALEQLEKEKLITVNNSEIFDATNLIKTYQQQVSKRK